LPLAPGLLATVAPLLAAGKGAKVTAFLTMSGDTLGGILVGGTGNEGGRALADGTGTTLRRR
jgi:hypothetical protein